MSEKYYMGDPAMEAARKEILDVLRKHDLMGTVMICGRERSGFFVELSPSWSCAKAEETPEGDVLIHIKAEASQFTSLEEQKAKVEMTLNGMMGLLHVQQYIEANLRGLMEMVSEKFHIKHVAMDSRIQRGRMSG